MKARQFFVWVWRLNAVVILAVGVVGFFALLFASAVIYKEMTRTRQANGVINVTAGQVETEKVSLGEFHRVEGTDVLRAPLQIEQEYALGSLGSKGTDSLQNYLYFEPKSNASYWLIPGNRGLILDSNEIPLRNYGEEKEPSVAFAYVLVDEDSNGDGKLTRNDVKTIAVSLPTGKAFTRLNIKAEHYNGAYLTGRASFVVLYTAEETLRAAEVALPSMKLLHDSPVKPQ